MLKSQTTLTLAFRLRVMALGVTLAVLGLAFYTAYDFFNASMEQRLGTARTVVDQALQIAGQFHEQEKAGQLTADQARAKASEEIRKIRYEGQEYIWINDLTPRMVMHPFKPELEGKDLTDFVDPAGKRMFVEFVATVRKNGKGYVDYQWPKPGSPGPEPKRSYVTGFAPWGWVIGSGVYVDAARASAVRFATTCVVIGLAVGLGVFIFVHLLARNVQRRMDEADRVLRAIAAGDLTTTIDPGRPDEIGRVLATMVTMRDSLSRMVSQVNQATDSILVASNEIAQGNLDLSGRTEQQASSLQQTAASMEEMTNHVKSNGDAASQANDFASSAAGVAARGGSVVDAAIARMNEITEASRKIEAIIGVIDGIAFQTNILALNAAVEAARAGEEGRGFAVVATEVRMLAQRSAVAAREIKDLIADSVSKVEAGAGLVNEAGSTMTEVTTRVQGVAEMIARISSANREQTTGIVEVNQAVIHLDQMTQQNAALVEQSAAAAASLRQQAAQLAEAVAVFRLAEPQAA